MPYTSLPIEGAWLRTPQRHFDTRGFFQEDFKYSEISNILGVDFKPLQSNRSKSKAGVIRGIHWSKYPPGQAKFVTCSVGEIWDVVIDLRQNSPTFMKWHAEVLSAENGRSILISEGLGHAFLSLQDGSIVNYLCSSEYNPLREFAIHPLDKDLSIEFEGMAAERSISELMSTESRTETFLKAQEHGSLN